MTKNEWLGHLHKESWVGGFWMGAGVGGLVALTMCIWLFTHFH